MAIQLLPVLASALVAPAMRLASTAPARAGAAPSMNAMAAPFTFDGYSSTQMPYDEWGRYMRDPVSGPSTGAGTYWQQSPFEMDRMSGMNGRYGMYGGYGGYGGRYGMGGMGGGRGMYGGMGGYGGMGRMGMMGGYGGMGGYGMGRMGGYGGMGGMYGGYGGGYGMGGGGYGMGRYGGMGGSGLASEPHTRLRHTHAPRSAHIPCTHRCRCSPCLVGASRSRHVRRDGRRIRRLRHGPRRIRHELRPLLSTPRQPSRGHDVAPSGGGPHTFCGRGGSKRDHVMLHDHVTDRVVCVVLA